MPFKAIFKASTFGATLKAVGRSINSLSTSVLRLIVKSCIPSSTPDTDRIRQLGIFFFQDQFADHGREVHDFHGRDAANVRL